MAKKDGSLGELRSFNTLSKAFRLYANFHAEVSCTIVERKVDLLIDCHSFSNLPNLLNTNFPDIDICIGYNDDETHPDDVLIGNLIHLFSACGYKVGVNAPFSNSKTFEVPTDYHSVMIEINKRVYMDEQTQEKTEGFLKLKKTIDAMYEEIVLSDIS